MYKEPSGSPYMTNDEFEKLHRGWEDQIEQEDPYGHFDPDEEPYRKRIAECASFPDHVKTLRIAHGWSLMHLSDLLECSEMHIRHLEHGRRHPSYKMFLKLAEIFDVDRDALLDEALFEVALEQIPKEADSERK